MGDRLREREDKKRATDILAQYRHIIQKKSDIRIADDSVEHIIGDVNSHMRKKDCNWAEYNEISVNIQIFV